MQVVYKNKDKESSGRGADLVGVIIYARRVGRHLEGEYVGGLKSEIIRIWDSNGVFSKYKKRVWERRQEVGTSGKTKEEVGTRRKNNKRICSRVQKRNKYHHIPKTHSQNSNLAQLSNSIIRQLFWIKTRERADKKKKD